MDTLKQYTIHRKKSIREAFKQETTNKGQCVFVVNNQDEVLGIVTDGDFRRAIWNGISLEKPIESIMNTEYISFGSDYTQDEVVEKFRNTNVNQIPILKAGRLQAVLFRENFDFDKLLKINKKLSIPVVIMAGGKGTRLDPFTCVLPKPLIPIGNKTVIERIIDKFAEFGITQYYISVNHKEKMIKAFFEDTNYELSYITENGFLGTAGALKKLEGEIQTPFFVSNCDVIIDTDYSEILSFHQRGNYDFTLIGSMQHYIIPYGVCKLKEKGELGEMIEKPHYDFLANTGLYLLNPEVINFIPSNGSFDMTQLINRIQKMKRRIGVYPVCAESWIDVGQWEEYRKAIKKLDRCA